VATTATEFIDTTTAAVFIPVIWSREAIIAREQKLNFAPAVNRRFEKELTFGSAIHVPSVVNLTAQDSGGKNTSNNTAVVWETITETNTDLTINKWYYSGVAIESFTKKQSMQDLMARYAPKQGYALALVVDDALATLVLSISSSVGTLAQDVDYETALRAVQYLNDANAPQEDRCWFISPAQYTAFMKLDQFIHDDYKSLNSDVTQGQADAYCGKWMRTPVYMSTNVDGTNAAGHSNALMQKECLALAVQMEPVTHNWFDVNYLADKFIVEEIFGSAIMRNDHGVLVLGG
jgi:hypothetical protein